MGEEATNALRGKRVVVTRAAEQSEPLVQALRERGAVPVVMPMVAFGPPDDPSFLDNAIRELPSYDWIFLTSQNALRALQERCKSLGLSLEKLMEGVRVAVVGPTTAEAVENAGLKVAYLARKHQGVSLAEELAGEIQGKRVLLPRSDRGNRQMVEKMEQIGTQVKEIVAYKTIRPDKQDLRKEEAMVREGVDAILFFSPSAVHHLQDLLGNEKFQELSKGSAFAAIGPVTEEALREAKIERVVLAQDTTVAAVLAALTKFFSQPGSRLPAGVKPG